MFIRLYKFVLILLSLIPLSIISYSQDLTPFTYQFILRDKDGEKIAYKEVSVNVGIYTENILNENLVYSEKHNVEVLGDGLVTIEIGNGNSNQDVSDIIWNIDKSYFVKAEVDDFSDDNYVFEHSSPLIFFTPQIFSGSANNLADPYLQFEESELVDVLKLKGNKLYLSNGSVVELPEYLKNSNSLLIDVQKRNVSCYGENDGAIDVTVKGGTPPYEFYWSNEKHTEDLNNLEAGDYTLYVTDKTGFTALKRIKVSQPERLEIESKVTDVSDIGKTDGRIDLDVSGGRPPYSYQWSNGSYSADQKELEPGRYKVTVFSKSKCSVEKNFVVKEPIKISFDKQNVKCYGGKSGSVRLGIRGGKSPYEIQWSNNKSGLFQDELSAGKYYVYVKDSWGNSVFDSVNVLQPYPLKVETVVQNVDAENGKGRIDLNVSGGIPPYKYRWSNMDTTKNLDDINDGVYSVTVSDINSCKAMKNNIFVYRMMVDMRDTTNYKVITIGSQVWMAENLNYGKQILNDQEALKNNVVEKYCYEDNPEYCKTLGGLYNWDEMMQYNNSDDNIKGETQGVCPDGWHIPTNDEWQILADYLGGEMVAANKMKNYDYWASPDRSNEIHLNLSGFSAYPSGRMDMTGESYYLRKSTSFWSATKDGRNKAWHRTMTNRGAGLYRNSGLSGYRFSVRCIKDY